MKRVRTLRLHKSEPVTNQILAALPIRFRQGLETLEPVILHSGTVLFEPDEKIEHVYFLKSALVSLVSTNSEGAAIEIGLIGYEGMVGVPAILGGVTPHRAVVQVAGEAFRMRGKRLHEEFRRNPFLRDLLLRYTNAFLIQIAQSCVCNCYHPLQERLCRWLLVARDAVRGNLLPLTQDVIARLLGTRRASITVALGLLQRAGLIKLGRGRILIVDPAGLEAISCECYGIVRDGVRRVQAGWDCVSVRRE